jgi:hypothetical protein
LNNKPRVLMTATYGPHELALGEDLYNLMSTRWMRKHGLFQMDMYGHYFALYLIAENISNPTTVLEGPSWEEFDRELDEGYDYVGFQLKSVNTAKVARMIKRIREKCPATKIVMGGYGVGTLGSPVPGDKNGDAVYIRENADYICKEEGVRFMRRLLNDEPVDREITQYQVPTFSLGGFLGTPGVHLRIPNILVSLGCPNGCDFCNTSALFNRQKTYVAEPEQVFRFIKNYQKRLGFDQILVMLWDEDLFLNPEYVRELGRLLRSDKSTWGVMWYAFGSIRSLSQYDPAEIRDCGCQMIWVGVESFQSGADQMDDRYGKRQGKEVGQVIADLQRHGIQVTGSLVLGLDFHTKENMKDDIDRFVALKPMFYQISHLLPCPGTALYDRLLEENRILDSYSWDKLHFWSNDIFKYRNLDKEEVHELFEYAHDQLRDVNGPPTLQMLESTLDAYQLVKSETDKYHRFMVIRYQVIASGLYTVLEAVQKQHPSPKVRERARMLEERYRREIAAPSALNQAVSSYAVKKFEEKSAAAPAAIVSNPPPRWTYYHTFDEGVWVKKGSGAKEPKPYRDAGFFAGQGLPEMMGWVGQESKKIDVAKDL